MRSMCLPLLLAVAWSSPAEAADWPMWRCDAMRSAASAEQLPPRLAPHWRLKLPPRTQAWDDPLNLDLMSYDRIFEPIVAGGCVLVGFNDQDKLACYDLATGRHRWTFFTDGPVRLPPATAAGRVYFCSDDGHLYCVDIAEGRLQWRLRGGPSAQQAIGNQRYASAWPARGGPVVRDGMVYFAASIWPFMGTFIYAVDADSGEVRWVNDSTAAQYLKQPHSAPSFAGVAPQGALVATDQLLLIPGGRSVPAALDRADGTFRYFEINAGGKGNGGSFVVADERHFYCHTRGKGTRAFQLKGGLKTAFMPNEPVLRDGIVYSAEGKPGSATVKAYTPSGDLQKAADYQAAWELPVDGLGDLIAAGDRLYAAGRQEITAIDLPRQGQPARIAWRLPLEGVAEGPVQRLLAADGVLLAVTGAGEIIALGDADGAPSQMAALAPPVQTPSAPSESSRQRLAQLLAAGDAEGYALWYARGEDDLQRALTENSPFVQLACVIDDVALADATRRRLESQGLYGKVTAHASSPGDWMPPRYTANMVFVGSQLAATVDSPLWRKMYDAVRPYGGVLYALAAEDRRESLAKELGGLGLEQAEVEVAEHGVVVRRIGRLVGSSDWTHQNGNIANTLKSDDQRVKLPLGVLWFGGSSNMDVLPRHGHGPPEQVVGGRLFIQGINLLSARDVYTGRVLWRREFKDLGTFDVYYDKTYTDEPLNTKYNQVHIPGANGRGTNYVVTDDRVYLIEGDHCLVLDPATGKTLQQIDMPRRDPDQPVQWGYIGVYKDVLIGGQGFADYRRRHSLTFLSDKVLSGNKAGFGSKSLDRAASMGLVAFDRHTGRQLWKIDANHSFWHNGIVAGGDRIYCLDKNPAPIQDAMRRRGVASPDTYRVLALDYRTGKPLWSVNEGVFGTWLGYSSEHDLLLQAGAAGSDRLLSEVAKGMSVHRGSDGELVWSKPELSYTGPCVLHNDLIIANANSYSRSAGAFRLQDGQQKVVPNPLTGELAPWTLQRAYGCNNIIASEHLLTFRSGAAGFYDLLTDSGTGNFGGFKSGCTSNLVVANGVLNAPDYTRTCSCAYQNQTSLALVHMPELEVWTTSTHAALADAGDSIEQVGINFGAPGDRRDPGGRLWLEFPIVGGESPPLTVEVSDGAKWVRRHASAMTGHELPWVLASGVAAKEISIGMKLAGQASIVSGLPVRGREDDGEEKEDGDVDLGSSDLELVEDGGTQLVAVRFQALPLARGAELRGAHIQFTCDEPTEDTTSLIIGIEDAADAAALTTGSHDLSRRTRLRREVAWNPPSWPTKGAAGEAQRTPDLAALLQEVVARPDWKPGNAVVFLISGVGKRVAVAGGGNGAARLVIDADTEVLPPADKAPSHRVRLLLSAPAGDVGPCRFDIYLQQRRVASDIRLDPTDPARRAVDLQLDDIPIADQLHIRIDAKQGQPLVAGVEIQRSASGERPASR